MDKTVLLAMSTHEFETLIQEAVATGVRVALAEIQGQPRADAQLLTRTELANYLQITTHSVTNMVKRGMPYLGIGAGADRRFRLNDVEAWLKERQHANGNGQ